MCCYTNILHESQNTVASKPNTHQRCANKWKDCRNGKLFIHVFHKSKCSDHLFFQHKNFTANVLQGEVFKNKTVKIKTANAGVVWRRTVGPRVSGGQWFILVNVWNVFIYCTDTQGQTLQKKLHDLCWGNNPSQRIYL